MQNFEHELSKWGPDARTPPLSVSEAESYCATLAGSHYENFPVLTRFVPRSMRPHFASVYAYCRWADDLADEVGDPVRSLELLAWWRELLADCFDCSVPPTTHPVFTALHGTINACAIPQQPFADLISAFEQDQTVHRYETFDELRDYCRRSADPVGRLVLYVIGEARPEYFDWSDAICTGLQLANFWQDVARDHDIGRVYLPAEDRRRFGYSDDDLAERRENEAFRALMKFEVDRAEAFLVSGLPLADALGGRFGAVIDLYARGGLRILERIRGMDYRVLGHRPTVTRLDGVRLIVGTLGRTLARTVVGRRTVPRSEREAEVTA